MWPQFLRGVSVATQLSWGIAGGALVGTHDGSTFDVYAGSCVGVSVGRMVTYATKTSPVTTLLALMVAPIFHVATTRRDWPHTTSGDALCEDPAANV